MVPLKSTILWSYKFVEQTVEPNRFVEPNLVIDSTKNTYANKTLLNQNKMVEPELILIEPNTIFVNKMIQQTIFVEPNWENC